MTRFDYINNQCTTSVLLFILFRDRKSTRGLFVSNSTFNQFEFRLVLNKNFISPKKYESGILNIYVDSEV